MPKSTTANTDVFVPANGFAGLEDAHVRLRGPGRMGFQPIVGVRRDTFAFSRRGFNRGPAAYGYASASAPPTISAISLVMVACRARFSWSVNEEIILPALSVALDIDVICAPWKDATLSRTA